MTQTSLVRWLCLSNRAYDRHVLVDLGISDYSGSYDIFESNLKYLFDPVRQTPIQESAAITVQV